MHTSPHRRQGPFARGLLLSLTLGFPVAAAAAPGTLAQSPLFASASVKPNIFFVLDDSSSMAYSLIKSPGARIVYPTYAPDEDADPLPSTNEEVLRLCAGYNVLAYDPTVTYTPWFGEDSAGTAYGNRTLSDACTNPYDPATCGVDLVAGQWIYFTWTDANGDGEYQSGECPVYASQTASGPGVTAASCSGVTGCVAAANASAPAGIDGGTNFANWYTYYRTRDHVLKRAVSEILFNSEQRMGLATLANIGSPSTPIRDLSDTASTSVCGGSKTHKQCLLDRLFKVTPGSGQTLLRRGLYEAGYYFDQNDSGRYHEYLGPTELSPILSQAQGGNCQQNFVVAVSDGTWTDLWRGNLPIGNTLITDSAGQQLLSIGDEDSGGSISSNWDEQSFADLDDTGNPTCYHPFFGAYEGLDDNTLADIAMHFYETDLSSLANDVPTVAGLDENDQQHLVTFTVAFGVDGTVSEDPPDRSNPYPWPPICQGTQQNYEIDDMRHAAWNGRGQFLSAKSPGSVAQALSDALSSIAQLTGATAAAVGFNTARLTTDTLAFLVQFDTTDWSGNLFAFEVDPRTGQIDQMAVGSAWGSSGGLPTGAADLLPVPSQRLILTKGATDGVELTPANWANLSATMQSDLRTNDQGVQESDAAGRKRLEWLRGDQSCEVASGCAVDLDGDGTNETLKLRTRASLLGDIVNSSPIVIGAPSLNWPSTGTSFFPTRSGNTYAKFKSDNANRTPVVYVGANDGALHGFKATNLATDTDAGEELIAYVPAALASSGQNEGLHYLSEPAYGHRFYVDRTPSVSDVYIDPTGGGSDSWRTVAVGGLGAGGRGIYALDITDPSAFSAANAANIVLWEFTSANDAELGYTFSQPIIAMMNNGQWAAIVGSGYNDSGTDDAHLFVVFLEGGVDGDWTDGSADYVKIEATISGIAERNGLSSPAVADLDGNGTADRVYAGDLLGNLWVFDTSDADSSNWSAHKLFTATDAGGNAQPITAKPAIAKHPSVSDDGNNQPNVMVYVGTGQYLTDGDLTTTTVQSFYGVWDKGDFSRTPAHLQQQTFVAGFNNQVVTDTTINWATQHGWYINLPDSGQLYPGERVIADAVLRGGVVFFNSILPSDAPCGGGGSGFLYALDMINGGRPDEPPFDTNGDAVVDINDKVADASGNREVAGRKTYGTELGTPSPLTILGNSVYTTGSRGQTDRTATEALQGLNTGRLSWQQLDRE